MSTQGKLFPICCSSEISIRALNGFLSTVYKHGVGGAYFFPQFVVIDDLDNTYTEATLSLDGRGTFRSPFVGKGINEVARIVREMHKSTKSDITSVNVVILTGDSVNEDWAWVVHVGEQEDKWEDLPAVRVEGKSLHQTIAGLNVSKPTIGELQEMAGRTEDGIIRMD